MTKLNPNAASFHFCPTPSASPNPAPMASYHQGYVVSSAPLTPYFPRYPPPSSYNQPSQFSGVMRETVHYFHHLAYYQPCNFSGAMAENVHDLHPETTIDTAKKHEDASKRDSKRRNIRDMVKRNVEAGYTKGFRPPRLSRRPNGTVGCDRRIQVGTFGNYRVFPRNKKSKNPLVEGNTTIMIRNIPNKYTRAMLIEFLDHHCLSENQKLSNNDEGGEPTMSAFDLVYLPIDFKTKMNKGYGFVNFTTPEGAWRFYVATNNKKWEFFQSRKISEIVAARCQGKDNFLVHLSSMKLPADWDEVKPLCFSPPRDGTAKGSQRPLGKPNEVCNNHFSGRSSRPSGCQWKPKEKTPSPPVERVSYEEKEI